MLKKKLIRCLCVVFAIVVVFADVCYAVTVPVTVENLKESFEKVFSSEVDGKKYDVTVSDNVINILVDNESYTLNYDLTDKPTFTLGVNIEKGMSYEDYKKKTDNLNLPILGYIAVANIQGVAAEDASLYILSSYLQSALNGSNLSKNSYVIVDDLNISEGVTINKTDDPKTIYTSEFGNKVMEFVNDIYKDKQTISDSTSINSYLLTIEKVDTTDTSCKLVSKLNVNPDADFSKLIGYQEGLEVSFINKDITKENADLVLTLKKGQKCKIESIEKITGYSFSGSDCADINDDYTEIIAKDVGKQNGYIYFGEKTKTIFITVEENTQNTDLGTITLNIELKDEVNPSVNDQKDSTLPNAGISVSISTLIIMSMSIAIVLSIVYVKKRTD